MVVNAIGDDRLSRREVTLRILPFEVSGSTMQGWLRAACANGLLRRERHVIARTREYVYFKSILGESVSDDFGAFVFMAICPCCGDGRRIEFVGAGVDIEHSHGHMTWDCHGCGNDLRLADCVSASELVRSWTTWKDSRNPDLDIVLPLASPC